MHFIFAFLLLITVLLVPASAEADVTAPTLYVNVVADDGTVRVFGTVTDASGVDRVEVKFDGSSWKTADLSGNNFTITEEVNITGSHVVEVRAFDIVGNPTPINTTTYYAVKKSTSTDDDLSFYVRLANVKITSLNLSGNVREMEYPQDFAVEFKIVNDDSVYHKIRYQISVNDEELTEDVTIRSNNDESVDERFGASLLCVGQNQVKIAVYDWETKQKIANRTINLNVKASEKPIFSENSSNETEVWLKEFAELNGLMLPQNNQNVPDTAALELKISQIESKISQLESVQPVQTVPEKSTNWEKYCLIAAVVLILVVCFYLYRSGKLDDLIQLNKKEPPVDPEADIEER